MALESMCASIGTLFVFLCVVLYVEMCEMGMLSGVVVVFCLGSKIGFGGSIMAGGGGSGCEL